MEDDIRRDRQDSLPLPFIGDFGPSVPLLGERYRPGLWYPPELR
jgi:hypothetical protein